MLILVPLRGVSIILLDMGAMPMNITSINSIDWSLMLSVTCETTWALLISTLAGIAVGGFPEHMTLKHW